MIEILCQAAAYLLLIFLGATLKKRGFFHESDFKILSKILLNITLPCAIIYNYAHITLEASLLILTVFSLICGFSMLFIGMMEARLFGRREEMVFDAVNMSGFNIGNFCLPFAQSFLTPLSLLGIYLFDAGNAVIANGSSKAVGALIQNYLKNSDSSEGKNNVSIGSSVRTIVYTLSHSVPFVTYIIMSSISLLRIPVPQIVVSFSSLGFQANPFVAMLMIGVGFKLKISRDSIPHVVRLLVIRYAVTLSLAVFAYFVLPFPLEIRQGLVLIFLSPIASAHPAYTADLGEDYELASTVNSISMLISIGLITAALLFLL